MNQHPVRHIYNEHTEWGKNIFKMIILLCFAIFNMLNIHFSEERAFVSLCTFLCLTPTFAMRPSTPFVSGEGPHGSDYAVQRVKLQRKPPDLEPSYNCSFIHLDLHT